MSAWAGFGFGILICYVLLFIEFVGDAFISLFGYEAGSAIMVLITTIGFGWIVIFPPNWLRNL